jgi:hypothetical protein
MRKTERKGSFSLSLLQVGLVQRNKDRKLIFHLERSIERECGAGQEQHGQEQDQNPGFGSLSFHAPYCIMRTMENKDIIKQ